MLRITLVPLDRPLVRLLIYFLGPRPKGRGRMNMRVLIAALSVAAFLVGGEAAFADKRVAFVAGNAAYKQHRL